LLKVDAVSVAYGRGGRHSLALRKASLDVNKGETVALVGESGSGKSTLARAIAGLVPPSAGSISLANDALAEAAQVRTTEQRRLIQFVFQNPDASLNPRATIRTTLGRPFDFFFPGRVHETESRVLSALADVRLDETYASRYPDQLSGGERQRVAIARALIAEPALLLCDEILSALDVSVQASILTLLQRLKTERGIAMLFISHDLAVVRTLADRVIVLFRGDIVESGTCEQVFTAPFHPYTHALLEAIPAPRKRLRRAGGRRAETSTSRAGCAYAGRCAWQIGAVCETELPPWRTAQSGLAIRCHHSLEELERRATWPGDNSATIHRSSQR
jgi:peptide/nickel transport system ATP-binding protein